LAGVKLFPATEESIGEIKKLYSRHSNCRCIIREEVVYIGKKAPTKIVDYTAEAMRKATPGKGKLEYLPDSIVKKMSKQDYKVYLNDKSGADWLHKTLGGNIKMVHADSVHKSADYLWNGKYLEKKTIYSGAVGKIERRLREAYAQTSDKCVLLEISQTSKLSQNIPLQKIRRLMGVLRLSEILIKSGEKLVRYFKKI
jgi:hypothetical protein